MNTATAANIAERVARIETMPSIPAVLLPLLDMLNAPPDRVRMDEVVKLVSYDNAIALQTLRVASSPLFGLARAPQSVKSAVISLGLRKVQTILLTCCLGQAFPVKNWPLQPSIFWRHSLGCAMVCRKICERLPSADKEHAYMAGLLHDIGFMVNCLAFRQEFTAAVELACTQQIPLYQAEQQAMGFTHCETGRALAERWHLHQEIVQVIAFHHSVEQSESARALVSLVHVADLLCRMRNLGYGYYERQKADLVHDPAWGIISKEHSELAAMDLVRFTFELDDELVEIDELVSTILGARANG